MIAPVIDAYLPVIFDDGSNACSWSFSFDYKNFNEIQQAEIKIYSLNNKELSLNISSGSITEDKKIIIVFSSNYRDTLQEGSFYKATIRFKLKDETYSPWSNFGIFKSSVEPKISIKENIDLSFECNYNYSGDITEPPEKLEYYYIIDEKNQKIKTVYFSNKSEYNKICELDSLFNYADFREAIQHSVSLICKFYTKNGIYECKNEEIKKLSIIDNTNDYFQIASNLLQGNNDISIKNLPIDSYIIGFNNNVKIFNGKNPSGFIDYQASYKNNYQFFIPTQTGCIRESYFIINDFNGAYLIDVKNDKTLNITLNNKLNSFKSNRLEQKVDTIGGQYPIFFRNAQSNYREFPLSGTISYQSLISLESDFCTLEELGFAKNATRSSTEAKPSAGLTLSSTSQTAQDIYAERIFREKVLEFLLENRPLLFKSPTEGNIIVKLMNVSLTPNQQLERMIYDFSCTCYEVQDLESYLMERGNNYEVIS